VFDGAPERSAASVSETHTVTASARRVCPRCGCDGRGWHLLGDPHLIEDGKPRTVLRLPAEGRLAAQARRRVRRRMITLVAIPSTQPSTAATKTIHASAASPEPITQSSFTSSVLRS